MIIVSKYYIKKAWAIHELKSAQARAFEENSEYILPIRLDDAELPGLPSTIAYLDARTLSLNEICHMFISKLDIRQDKDVIALLNSDDRKKRLRALNQIVTRGDIEHFESIVELMLSDPIGDIRQKAAWVLDNLNDSRAITALVQAIHDPVFQFAHQRVGLLFT
jgi:hypothetical protein